MTATLCACGRPTEGAVLCDGCKRTLAYALVHVSIYWTDLGNVATKQTRYGNGAGTRTIGKAQPLPVDLRFIDQHVPDEPGDAPAHHGAHLAPGSQLRYDVWDTLVAWCRTLMEVLPERIGPACEVCIHSTCTSIRRDRWPSPGRGVPGLVNYLARQHRYLEAQTWAPVILDELVDVERRLRRMVDRPADRWYAGRCSETNAETGATCQAELYARTDRGEIACPGCGARWDVSERRDFLLEEAKAYLVTATEAAGALLAWTDYDGSETKLVDRIRKWRTTGQLATHEQATVNGRPRHLYRLGEIQALMVATLRTSTARSSA